MKVRYRKNDNWESQIIAIGESITQIDTFIQRELLSQQSELDKMYSSSNIDIVDIDFMYNQDGLNYFLVSFAYIPVSSSEM